MLAASVCWSFGGLFIKLIPWPSMSIVGMRAVLAALVFAAYRRSIRIKISKGNVIAALCLSSTTMLFVFANKLTTAAAAILLQFTAPVFIIIIELIFYKKRPKISEIVAAFITILGMLLFFADRPEAGSMLGNSLALISGLTFAGVFICNKRPDVSSEQSLFLGFVFNAVIGLPFILTGVTASAVAWGAVIFLGVIQVGIAYVFFSIGIKWTSALFACLITATEPVLNPVWVAIVLREYPGPYALVGGAVIVLTIVLYNVWSEKVRRRESAL